MRACASSAVLGGVFRRGSCLLGLAMALELGLVGALSGCADKAPPPNWPDPPPPLLSEPIGQDAGTTAEGAEPAESNGKAQLVPAVEPESDRLFGGDPEAHVAGDAATTNTEPGQGEGSGTAHGDSGETEPNPETEPHEPKERVPDDTGNGGQPTKSTAPKPASKNQDGDAKKSKDPA